MPDIQSAKEIVRRFTSTFDNASDKDLRGVASDHFASDFLWRGMYPFYELSGPEEVMEGFWLPLRKSLHSLQRREDIFFAGLNDVDAGKSTWTCSMGHFMGLFDADFLGIPKTGRLTSLRYAEFMRVEGDKISESAFFFDLIGLMQQAGVYPLPPMTGNYFVYPGPLTHDGQQISEGDPRETSKTIALVNEMIEDLRSINHLDDEPCPPDLLRRTWHEDMLWYGPSGIGATYTIPRYQKQHQFPFRMN
ncbi:MAG: ester cyclase, partial [Pseudomonadota bacterium]